jgi:hypothetical protein
MSEAKRKIGQGHPIAMLRLGLKELTHNILPAFPNQGQHLIEEPGLWGNPTQGEVAKARKSPGDGPDEESPAQETQQKKYTLEELRGIAAQKSKDAEQQMERGHEHDRGIER